MQPTKVSYNYNWCLFLRSRYCIIFKGTMLRIYLWLCVTLHNATSCSMYTPPGLIMFWGNLAYMSFQVLFKHETNQNLLTWIRGVHKQQWCQLFARVVLRCWFGMYTDQFISLTHFGLEEGGWVLFSLTSDLLHPPTLLCNKPLPQP